MAWIGKWMIGVAVIHLILGFVFMRGTLAILVSEGFFNTVNGQPPREATFWFLYTGFMLLLLGVALNRLEKLDQPLPKAVSWGFPALTALGAVVMPISGIWLLIPPAIGMLLRVTGQTGSPRE